MLLLLVFPSFFLNTSQEIGWEERLRNDSFGVEWDVKQQPTNQPTDKWRQCAMKISKIMSVSKSG